MSKRRIRYAPPKGPVAIAPKAWGQEFEFLFGEDEPKAHYTEEGDYAVVCISGPLSQRATFFGDNYESIRTRFASALESDKATVCLRIDSPGGDFPGCLELSRELRAMAQAAGKKLVAFTNSDCLSAAYAIATAAETIVATETASLGAIGVWAARIDVTRQDAMMGVQVVIAASGRAKADRNPHVPITDESLTRLQEQVDEQSELFFELVAEHRGMAVSELRAIEGADKLGRRALALGLADALVNSWSAFLSNPEGQAMGAKASKYMDEAKVALRRAAEGDDEEEKKMAEKALKALEKDEEKEEEKEKEGEGEEEGEGKKADAEGEGKKAESKKSEGKAEGKPIDGDGDKDDKAKKAKALAAGSNELTLAAEVAEHRAEIAQMKAERAAEKEAIERGKLYASRPDLSAAQKKAFDRIPIADAKALIDAMPRVTVTPAAAAAAMFPAAAGEPRKTYVPNLSQSEHAILAKLDQKPSGPARAEMVGATLQMPKNMTPAQAADYAKELEKELEGMAVR